MRLALVIFALWILAVEPSVGAYERFEAQAPLHERHRNDAPCDLDQPIPPAEVMAPSWKNHHLPDPLAISLPDAGGLSLPLHLLASPVSPVPLPAELSMPCSPSALPLRL